MTPAMTATFAEPLPEPAWSDVDAVIAYRAEIERPYAGTFDESRIRRLAETEVRRTADMATSVASPDPADDGWTGRVEQIRVRTLVLHGTVDPLFPLPHGEALARRIPGARLVALAGVGHEIPPPAHWDTVLAAVVSHTSPS